MSETALWLNYGLGAVIAFSVVYFRHWRVTSAMLLGAFVTLAIWGIVSLATDARSDDVWIEAGLIINGSIGLIFAAVGAALGIALRRGKDGT